VFPAQCSASISLHEQGTFSFYPDVLIEPGTPGVSLSGKQITTGHISLRSRLSKGSSGPSIGKQILDNSDQS